MKKFFAFVLAMVIGTVLSASSPESSLDSSTLECVKTTAPFYNDWVDWNRPACWCYQLQCRGDIDGTKWGIYRVNSIDISIFRLAYAMTDSKLRMSSNGICADLNHKKIGPFRVGPDDLHIIKQYVNRTDFNVPVCDSTYYNFWVN